MTPKMETREVAAIDTEKSGSYTNDGMVDSSSAFFGVGHGHPILGEMVGSGSAFFDIGHGHLILEKMTDSGHAFFKGHGSGWHSSL